MLYFIYLMFFIILYKYSDYIIYIQILWKITIIWYINV